MFYICVLTSGYRTAGDSPRERERERETVDAPLSPMSFFHTETELNGMSDSDIYHEVAVLNRGMCGGRERGRERNTHSQRERETEGETTEEEREGEKGRETESDGGHIVTASDIMAKTRSEDHQLRQYPATAAGRNTVAKRVCHYDLFGCGSVAGGTVFHNRDDSPKACSPLKGPMHSQRYNACFEAFKRNQRKEKERKRRAPTLGIPK
ncbi:hypothetical protein KIPB_001338 [Kipferlia bialata]|uniref:Uncharacterized protein n=1 Tax=Kipferlia bialata TaxID=797122 RepID=A0A9K3CQ44_9EUKA|nr:hypothetical protein KIPB_001338 [Kipferlia bialata]|eukprot:g1338.t1